MTKLLEQAFEQVARLPEPEQEAIATLVLDELASERRWDESFNRSMDTLPKLADHALSEHCQGLTKSLE